MRKSVVGLFILLLLVLSLVACDRQSIQTDEDKTPSGKDEMPPVLTIKGGEYLESTSSTLVIEGQLKDSSGIQSFMYRLNGGEYKDVLTSLEGESFRFLVQGLKENDTTEVDNQIEMIAADKNHQIGARVFANIVTFPNVFGRWQDLDVAYEACGKIQKAKLLMTFNPPRKDGAVGGFGKALFDNQAAQLLLDASVDQTNTITGKVEVLQGDKSVAGEVRLEFSGEGRIGKMMFDQWPCENSTFQALTVDVILSKNNEPMTIIEDSKKLTDEVVLFEPNNKPSEATGVILPFRSLSYYMIVDEDDKEDWFSFSLKEPSIITAILKPSQPMSQQSYELAFYDSNTTQVYPLSSDGRTGLLQAGSYYVKVSAAENSNLYDFELSAKPVADNALEPNQNRAQATAMPSGFQRTDMIVSDGDEDWFTFTLDTPRTIRLTLDAFYGIEYTLYRGDTEIGSFQSAGFQGPQPIDQNLEAGTYYLKIIKKGPYPFLGYSLSFY